MHLYSTLLYIAVHTKHFTIMWGSLLNHHQFNSLKWQDYSSLAKRKMALQRTTINKTGVVPNDAASYSSRRKAEEKALSIIGTTASDGSCGVIDLHGGVGLRQPERESLVDTYHLPVLPTVHPCPSLHLQLFRLQPQHCSDLRMSVVVVRT